MAWLPLRPAVQCCCALVLLGALVDVALASDSSVMLFNLKPDVDDHVAVSKNGVTCTFHYAANGGSSEEWRLELSHKDEYEYECVVGRPTPPSYLYFNSYSLSVKGADELIEAAVFENSAMLPDSAVDVDEDAIKVSNKGYWSGTISLVEMVVEV